MRKKAQMSRVGKIIILMIILLLFVSVYSLWGRDIKRILGGVKDTPELPYDGDEVESIEVANLKEGMNALVKAFKTAKDSTPEGGCIIVPGEMLPDKFGNYYIEVKTFGTSTDFVIVRNDGQTASKTLNVRGVVPCVVYGKEGGESMPWKRRWRVNARKFLR